MSRFLIATVPLIGHVNPGLPIARALLHKGHEVWWYSGKKFRTRIEATGARFVPMAAAYDYDDVDLDLAFPGRTNLRDFAQLKFDLKHIFTDPAPGQVQDLETVLSDFSPDVFLGDAAFMGIPLLCERHGICFATFSTTVLGMKSRDTAPFGLCMMPNSSALGHLRNRALYWLFDTFLFRDVEAYYKGIRAKLALSMDGYRPFFEGSLGPYLYLHGTVPGFEYPRRDLPPQVHFTGPFLPPPTPDFRPPAWWSELKSGRPVIHITQGTVATNPNQLLIPALKALAEEDVLVIAVAGGQLTQPIGFLPANARLESFIPHSHLLPHVDVMITNAGFGGTQMALAHGIPLIAAAGTDDKPEIASRIAWSGAGINLHTKTPSPEQIRKAVHEVLTNASYRRQAQKLQAEMARYDMPTRTVMLLEQLAQTKKPVVNLPGAIPYGSAIASG